MPLFYSSLSSNDSLERIRYLMDKLFLKKVPWKNLHCSSTHHWNLRHAKFYTVAIVLNKENLAYSNIREVFASFNFISMLFALRIVLSWFRRVIRNIDRIMLWEIHTKTSAKERNWIQVFASWLSLFVILKFN